MEKQLNLYFDHTSLKADVTQAEIKKLCDEAKEYGFYAVCVNSRYIPLVKKELKDSNTKIAAVVGFPLGANATDVKGFETHWACKNGAHEIDMVINVGALKEKDYEFVLTDIKEVVRVSHERNALVKVILETCLLTDEEIVKACELCKEAKADFVKTSTGFSTGGAEARHVKLMKDTVGNALQVKASGGIRDLVKTLEMIEAGADRIGASASVDIVKEHNKSDTE